MTPNSRKFWTKERRAKQSATAKRAWAKKAVGASAAVAASITEDQYLESIDSLAVFMFFDGVRKTAQLKPARFVALAKEAGVDEALIPALYARLREEFV